MTPLHLRLGSTLGQISTLSKCTSLGSLLLFGALASHRGSTRSHSNNLPLFEGNAILGYQNSTRITADTGLSRVYVPLPSGAGLAMCAFDLCCVPSSNRLSSISLRYIDNGIDGCQ